MYYHYLPFLFPFFFVGMWVLVTFFVSRMGWAALVDRYAAFPEFTGTRIGMISASINGAEYKNSLVLHYNEQGMHLRPVVVFRLFHPPLFIPWGEVKSVRERKLLFFRSVELEIGDPRAATITFSAPVYRRMERFLPAL